MAHYSYLNVIEPEYFLALVPTQFSPFSCLWFPRAAVEYSGNAKPWHREGLVEAAWARVPVGTGNSMPFKTFSLVNHVNLRDGNHTGLFHGGALNCCIRK